MKTSLLFCVAVFSILSASAQYSATTLTRKVAPRPQAAPAQPAAPAYGGAAAQPGAPVDPAKVAAQKQKTESDLIKYHRQRAEAGSDNAQYELAVRYLTGNGVEKDEKLGREWLLKSAKAGNVKAIKKAEELGIALDQQAAASATAAK